MGRQIAEAFERGCAIGHKNDEVLVLPHFNQVSFKDKVTDWQYDENIGIPEEVANEEQDVDIPEGVANEEQIGQELSEQQVEPGEVNKYREFVSKTSAYKWLLANMGRELTQSSEENDLLTLIRQEISEYMPPLPRLSGRRQLDALNLTFQVEWNPSAFIRHQQYPGDPTLALERVLTLTGSPSHAQALPCLEYLTQVWPTCGKRIIRLLQNMMRAHRGQQVQGTVLRLLIYLR